MNTVDYWNRVKVLIKSQNKTQEGLAKDCGIPFHTLQGQIAKNRLPNTIDGYKIASALGTTVEYLVTGTEADGFKEKYDKLKTAVLEAVQNN